MVENVDFMVCLEAKDRVLLRMIIVYKKLQYEVRNKFEH